MPLKNEKKNCTHPQFNNKVLFTSSEHAATWAWRSGTQLLLGRCTHACLPQTDRGGVRAFTTSQTYTPATRGHQTVAPAHPSRPQTDDCNSRINNETTSENFQQL